MKDTVIKETGNSRFLRSSVAEDITFAEFIALLRAGKLPVDLAGINEEGINTLGTALNKENLLNDETEIILWGSAADRTVNNALVRIFHHLTEEIAKTTAIAMGAYTGTGNETTITLPFAPKCMLIVQSKASADGYYASAFAIIIDGQIMGRAYYTGSGDQRTVAGTTTSFTTTVKFTSEYIQKAGGVYKWFAIG